MILEGSRDILWEIMIFVCSEDHNLVLATQPMATNTVTENVAFQGHDPLTPHTNLEKLLTLVPTEAAPGKWTPTAQCVLLAPV
jgi:hypothetical protein